MIEAARIPVPSKTILYAAAGFSLVAAFIHLWAIPEHFEEWWGYGAFFLASAVAQASYAIVLLARPGQQLLIAGIVSNSAIVLLYLVTRTLGIPFFGPEAGVVEEVGALDVVATASEAALVIGLCGMLVWRFPRQDRAVALVLALAAALLLFHLPHLVLFFRLIF
jgi:hypothetical protein